MTQIPARRLCAPAAGPEVYQVGRLGAAEHHNERLRASEAERTQHAGQWHGNMQQVDSRAAVARNGLCGKVLSRWRVKMECQICPPLVI